MQGAEERSAPFLLRKRKARFEKAHGEKAECSQINDLFRFPQYSVKLK
jgi:hypothetical protein